jgi:mRNA-degrading endonuclease RelE of RelBE toxin-antitoxin system
MDKITKALNKLSAKERVILGEILNKLKRGDFNNFDLKKLKNHDDIFRIRKGNIRIIYQLIDGRAKFLTIERRSNNTYNF